MKLTNPKSIALATAGLLALLANAGTYTWIGGSTNDAVWNNPANWDPEGVPAGGDTVDLGGDARVFASVSGSGSVINGQLNVTGTFAPDGLAISGTLNFAASGGRIVLPRTPKRGELVELGTAQAITGDWRSWTISPLPSVNSQGRLMIRDGKLCVQIGGEPFFISIR